MHDQPRQSTYSGIDVAACVNGLATVVAEVVTQQLAAYGPLRATLTEEDRRPRLLITVDEAAERLSIGRTAAYALVSSGELESVQIGRLRRVPASAVEEYVNRLRGLES